MGLARLGKLPLKVLPRTSVAEAVRSMVERKVGALVVMEGPNLLGVFTERDLMTRVVAPGKDPAVTPIGEVMTRNVYVVPDETSVLKAATLMRTNNIRNLPIVGTDGTLVAMVALRYLLYDLMDDLETKVIDLEGYLMEDSKGG
jgi:CBS domain-containing protein